MTKLWGKVDCLERPVPRALSCSQMKNSLEI